MNAIVIDTETTDTSDELRVIEFAYSVPLESPASAASDSPINNYRFSSDRPISLGAMATHHIIEDDLIDLPRFPGDLSLDFKSRGIDYIVGHNVDFDWRAIGKPDVKRICTLALCRALWPDIDSHTLTAMVYHLTDDRRLARERVRGAHSAEFDVEMVLEVVLPGIQSKLPTPAKTWEELWQISERARIPKIMPFGKHKGTPIAKIPRDYKRWLLSQPDVDPYLAMALTS